MHGTCTCTQNLSNVINEWGWSIHIVYLFYWQYAAKTRRQTDSRRSVGKASIYSFRHTEQSKVQ